MRVNPLFYQITTAGDDMVSPCGDQHLYACQILDGVPELVVDGLRKGVYGASHRFSVVRETWDDKPIGGTHNPKKLPERTITEARVFEFGPVTFPANPKASAAVRYIRYVFELSMPIGP